MAAQKVTTVAGTVAVARAGSPPQCRISLDGRVLKSWDCANDQAPKVIEHFQDGVGKYAEVLVIQEMPSGDTCTGGALHFLGVGRKSPAAVTRPLEFCGGKAPTFTHTGDTIIVHFPAGRTSRGGNPETWRYRNGTLVRAERK